jgi:hypothetical protein
VFLLGNWKNYDELEDQLSIDELIATLEAQRKVRREEHKFMAMIQGIQIPDDDIVTPDISQLTGARAVKEGFGIGLGVGHSQVEVITPE